MELFIWWLYDREIVRKEYVDKLFYILVKTTYIICPRETIQNAFSICPTTVGVSIQIVYTATINANVFADFKARRIKSKHKRSPVG